MSEYVSRHGSMNLRARGTPDSAGSARPNRRFCRIDQAFRGAGSWRGRMIAVLGLVLLNGCASLSVRTVPYLGVPRYASTAPASIGILQQAPARAHEKLGEVVVDASADPAPPVEKIEAALRSEAARLGADAVVLVHDQMHLLGGYVYGPWWSPAVAPIHGRVIIGVAIKYKAAPEGGDRPAPAQPPARP